MALAAASLLVAGCDTTSVEGSPTATSTVKNAGLFEPCDIPAQAIQGAGLDPASKDADFFGVQHTGWELCRWSASWYYLAVLSTSHTFDEVKNNPNNRDVGPVTVPGRDAVSSVDVSDVKREVCDVAFPSGQGAVIVRASTKGGLAIEENPCVVAVRAATQLNDAIPK